MQQKTSSGLTSPPVSDGRPRTAGRWWQVFSIGLIAIGLTLILVGGWMILQNWHIGASAALTPQSLEDNPLPVVAYSTPTPTPLAAESPTPTLQASPTAGASAPTPEAPPPIPPATSPPTRIVAEAIDLDAEVVEVGWHSVTENGQTYGVWEVAEYAAGWHQNSALPGNPGNIVLSGHHNIKGEVFRYLVSLEPGDVISLYADGRRYDYVVDQKFIVRDKGEPYEVRLENARWIGPFDDERLTLVTCWPYNDNTHRVIIISRPVPAEAT